MAISGAGVSFTPVVKTVTRILSGLSGSSVAAEGLIPAGAIPIRVSTKVVEELGDGNEITGYTVGDGSDADRWGDITGLAVGTSSDNLDWTVGTIEAFPSGGDVVLTPTGGDFDGDGAIEITVEYL